MNQHQQPHHDPVDVAVVGAGVAGLIFALALARAGVSVRIVDRGDLSAPPSDPRVFALAAGSRRVLAALGLWDALAADAAAVTDIVVADGGGAPLVHFDHAELDAGALGHVVSATALTQALARAVSAELRIEVASGATVTGFSVAPDHAQLAFDGGDTLRARLVVAADGKASRLRRAAGIAVSEWTYGQTALVFAIAHDRAHRGVAEEKFLAGGPFAVLPLPDGADGAHRSFVIWTERGTTARDLAMLGEGDFESELALRLGDRLGRARLAGPRHVFPLSLSLAEHYAAHRLALIGDAAHAIHPVAGQGLNLGIRDAAALAEIVVDASRLGLDIGMKTVLLDYERWRRFDNTCMAAATDLLERLFLPRHPLMVLARRAGMVLFDRIGPARRYFMKEAMGLTGELPRLARGEPL